MGFLRSSSVDEWPRRTTATTADRDVLADIVDLGESMLLEGREFVELLVPAVKDDYRALSVFMSTRRRIRANIHAVGGNRDHRISREMLTSWE